MISQEDSLIFQKCVSFGVEGALLIKAILKKKSPKNFAAADCELGLIQIKHIVDGLMEMKHSEVLRSNKYFMNQFIKVVRLYVNCQLTKYCLVG